LAGEATGGLATEMQGDDPQLQRENYSAGVRETGATDQDGKHGKTLRNQQHEIAD
jgi:hypothetical protein